MATMPGQPEGSGVATPSPSEPPPEALPAAITVHTPSRRATLLVCCAPAALGFATGMLTGLTGTDSTVVAALLPVVLTGIGGALLAFKLKLNRQTWTREHLVASAAVVLFSVFLIGGVHSGLFFNSVDFERESARESARQRLRLKDDLELRKTMLAECTRNEAKGNSARIQLGLPPLSPKAYCDVSRFDVFEIEPVPIMALPPTPGSTTP